MKEGDIIHYTGTPTGSEDIDWYVEYNHKGTLLMKQKSGWLVQWEDLDWKDECAEKWTTTATTRDIESWIKKGKAQWSKNVKIRNIIDSL